MSCGKNEVYGQRLIVHKCRDENCNIYYQIISDGPVEITAPEIRLTGTVRLDGNLEVSGDVLVHGAHRGDVRVENDLLVGKQVQAVEGAVEAPDLALEPEPDPEFHPALSPLTPRRKF